MHRKCRRCTTNKHLHPLIVTVQKKKTWSPFDTHQNLARRPENEWEHNNTREQNAIGHHTVEVEVGPCEQFQVDHAVCLHLASGLAAAHLVATQSFWWVLGRGTVAERYVSRPKEQNKAELRPKHYTLVSELGRLLELQHNFNPSGLYPTKSVATYKE